MSDAIATPPLILHTKIRRSSYERLSLTTPDSPQDAGKNSSTEHRMDPSDSTELLRRTL